MSNRIVLERRYTAAIEDVWDLWTTKEGIESWWGPPGFRVEVRKIDLRPGGELLYAMIAEAPEMVAYMQRSGMPAVQECRLRFTKVTAPRRLSYLHRVDFVPGKEVYEVAHDVVIEAHGDEVSVTVTIDRMHDDDWTNRAKLGWEAELIKLGDVLKTKGIRA